MGPKFFGMGISSRTPAIRTRSPKGTTTSAMESPHARPVHLLFRFNGQKDTVNFAGGMVGDRVFSEDLDGDRHPAPGVFGSILWPEVHDVQAF